MNQNNIERFNFSIRQNKVKHYQVTGLHLMVAFLLILLGTVTWAVPSQLKTTPLRYLDQLGGVYVFIGLAILVLTVFFNKRIIQTKKGQYLRLFEIASLLSICVYSFAQQWYLPASYTLTALIAIAFAYVWERKYQKSVVLSISEAGIFLPHIWKEKEMAWHDVSNIILKYNILTINCHDHRMFQFALSHQPDFSDQTFRQFVARQINEWKNKKPVDW